jgi:hypothetical protein
MVHQLKNRVREEGNYRSSRGKAPDRNMPVLGGIGLDKPETSPVGIFCDQFRLERIVFS